MVNEWFDLPEVACLYCEEKFHLDDYCNLHADDEIECEYCGKVMVIKYLDTIIRVNLSTQAKPAGRA